ncbi:class I SAM-dependent methyltransferase [Micromonospora sp. NPDC050276]|uniref:class I SAM-dependent methyltransferase n=1 Tax=Micromonospora sp. NPDC050276 TaxID=3364278 RepID=UPI0037B7385E
MRHAEFRHHRLVQVYDAECRWGPDDDFFQSVVDQTPAARVLDLGCGTGRLTVALAAAGHTVTGVDPAGASLAAARAKPGGERVTWLEGTSALLPERALLGAVEPGGFAAADQAAGRRRGPRVDHGQRGTRRRGRLHPPLPLRRRR